MLNVGLDTFSQRDQENTRPDKDQAHSKSQSSAEHIESDFSKKLRALDF
jgi:hypothetical protein